MTAQATSAAINFNNHSKRHYNAAEQAALIKQWESSGLSKAAFCRREGIRESAFYAWTAPDRTKKCKTPTTTQLSPAKIVKSQLSQLTPKPAPTNTASIQIELANGIRLRIPLPTTSDSLIKFIKELACN